MKWKHRIVERTYPDGSKDYRCERTGFFRKNDWRPMYKIDGYGNEFEAIFRTLEQAQVFLGIHPSQTQTKIKENVIWER